MTAPPPPPPAGRQARWWPAATVFVVLMAVSLGGFFAAGAAGPPPPGAETPTGEPIEVGLGVTVAPARGWQVLDRFAEVSPGSGVPGIRLGRGAAQAVILVVPNQRSAGGLLEEYVAEVLEPQASQLSVGTPESGTLPAGPAARVPYVGRFRGVTVSLEGEATTVIGAGVTGVVLDGFAAEGSYLQFREEVRHMAETLRAAS